MQDSRLKVSNLLALIAVMGLTCTAFTPIFGRIAEKTSAVVCQSHMKAIAQALLIYVQQWDGAFPLNRYPNPRNSGTWPPNDGDAAFWSWKDGVAPLLPDPSVWVCPANERGHMRDGTGRFPISYAYGGGSFHENALRFLPAKERGKMPTWIPRNIAEFTEPDRIIMLLESREGYTDAGPWVIGGTTLPNKGWFTSHQKGSHWAFVDGSVKWLRVQQTVIPRQLWDDPKGRSVRDRPFPSWYQGQLNTLAPEYKDDPKEKVIIPK